MTTSGTSDVNLLRGKLADIEFRARKLPWAKERQWRTQTHVWLEGDIPTIDLHDLSRNLGRQVVEQIEEAAPRLQTGAVWLITGRGKHSIGPSPLRQEVHDALGELHEKHGWPSHPSGPGRFVLLTDPKRAPRSATGRLGLLFWVVALAFGASLAYICANP